MPNQLPNQVYQADISVLYQSESANWPCLVRLLGQLIHIVSYCVLKVLDVHLLSYHRPLSSATKHMMTFAGSGDFWRSNMHVLDRGSSLLKPFLDSPLHGALCPYQDLNSASRSSPGLEA